MKEVLPFMVKKDLRPCTVCLPAPVGVSFQAEVCGVDLLLVSGVRLLHDCSACTLEFDVD